MNLNSNKSIQETIPHGSGINSDWTIERRNNKIYCRNYFDTMNEGGFYDAVVPFTLVIPRNSPINFKLHFAAGSHYYAGRYGLRDYLEDIFAYWLEK